MGHEPRAERQRDPEPGACDERETQRDEKTGPRRRIRDDRCGTNSQLARKSEQHERFDEQYEERDVDDATAREQRAQLRVSEKGREAAGVCTALSRQIAKLSAPAKVTQARYGRRSRPAWPSIA